MCDGIDVAVALEEYDREQWDDARWDMFQDFIRRGKTTVVFKKKNGDKRTMLCSLFSADIGNYDFKTEVDGKEVVIATGVQPVWSIEDGGWRSIKKGTIVSVELMLKPVAE